MTVSTLYCMPATSPRSNTLRLVFPGALEKHATCNPTKTSSGCLKLLVYEAFRASCGASGSSSPDACKLLVYEALRASCGASMSSSRSAASGEAPATVSPLSSRLSPFSQHTLAYVRIRQDTSGYVRILQHTLAYVSILEHT
jgi:hypothetical protein